MTATALDTLDLSCSSCGATITVEPGLRTATCAYCDSPSVVERPRSADRPEPAFVLGFVLDRDRAAAKARAWLASRWFARDAFRRAPIDKVRGVYVPAWLYGAVARSRYEAEIGEDYVVTETYTTTDSKGKTVTRTRRVTKTEWRPLAGEHDCYALDVIVSASHGIPNDELEAIEPFDLRAVRRYAPAMIAGFAAEEPSRTREASLELARGEATALVGRKLAAFMPGDSYRGLTHQTSLGDEVADLLLMPIWVFAVRWADDRPPVRVLVNGQSGEVTGSVARSWVKVLATVGIILAIIALAFAAIAFVGSRR